MRTIAFLPILVVICTLAVHAQQPKHFLEAPPAPERSVYTTLLSGETRAVISLNGAWEVSTDGGDDWSTVQVPSCFNDEDELRYRRSFKVPADLASRYRWKLVCYGVQYQSTIRINGQFVGQHESGMPFSIPVPEKIGLETSNSIEIDVSNQLDYTSTVPRRKLMLGNRTYGGIYRDIFLVGVPRIWIDDVRFDTRFSSDTAARSGRVKFNVRITSDAIRGMRTTARNDSLGTALTINSDRPELELRLIASTPAGIDTLPAVESGRATQAFTLESKRTANIEVNMDVANPALWGPGSPNLYDVTVQVLYQGALIDEQELKVGFRTITTRGDRILLNGREFVPKGVVYVEDSEQYGASVSYDMMRQDVQAIKDMGANMIRFPDGVPHPYVLHLCDELGLMAWIDAAIGTPPASQFDDEAYVRRSLDRIRFTVEAGGVHTCVSAYGLSAPVSGGDNATLRALARMRALVDSLDYRPFYCSSHSWSQELRSLVDIAGFSTLDIEPDELQQMIVELKDELAGSMPLVVLAYGKFVQLGNHNGYSDPISIEAQAKYISDVYGVLQEAGIGGIYWSFNDYRTDRPILTVNNDRQYLATAGLYSLDREQRQSAQMLGNLYTNQKIPDVLIGDYSPPSTVLFIVVGIICAFLFLLLINNSRRFRENVSRALLRPYNFFADIRDQRILSNVQTTLLGLVISATFAVIVASLVYYYRMNEAFDALTGTLLASDALKEFLNYITWRPALSIITFTVLFFLLLLLVACIIRLCAVFVRNRIFFSDAYSIAVWAALPVLLLIPIAMSLYRILEAPGTGIAVFLLMIGVFLWLLYRVLRGTSVVYDIRPLNVYGYALLSIVVLMALLYVTSGSTSATLSYISDGMQMYSGG